MLLRLKDLIDMWGRPKYSPQTNFNSILGTINIDTRDFKTGDFFVPLEGENHNGHDFLRAASELGAQGAIASSKYISYAPKNLLCWEVNDTLHAYQQLALLHRKTLTCPIVAITGSVGKTTTREMIRSTLLPLGKIVASSENNNNDIGVPKTLLKANSSHAAVIVEMGMRGSGEIKKLSCCTNPDIAVITNIGTSHLGRLGSREAIANAKCEITNYMNPDGTVIIPAGQELLENALKEVWQGNIKRVALENDLSNINTSKSIDILGSFDRLNNFLSVNNKQFLLPLEGIHNARNFLLALTVAKLLLVDMNDIKETKVYPLPGRNRRFMVEGITILDETYNASPESVEASLELLKDLPGRHFAVLGTMLELGESSIALHKRIARKVVEFKLDGLIIISNGPEGREMSSITSSLPYFNNVSNVKDAESILRKWLQPGDVILLKASRSIGLDSLLPAFGIYD